jgi:hypothetical protein
MNASSGAFDRVHANALPVRRRVVLFGASNLTRAFPRVVAALRAEEPRSEILSAHGHGRSYGSASTFLGRELPSILACGLWRALEHSRPERTDALLTDIGNDIMYGTDVATIAGWIGECAARLTRHGARVAIVRLPLASLERLSRLRYEIVRALFFPTRRLAFETALERARELDARLPALAEQHAVALIETEPHWYGIDPIHIRSREQNAAWTKLLSGWNAAPTNASERARLTWRERAELSLARPDRMRRIGRVQTKEQPCVVLDDGTTVAIY